MKVMKSQAILIYENRCPKCRLLSKLIYFFDIKGQFTFVPIRSKAARQLLKEFYENPPYNFHMIDDSKNLCYTGLKAVPAIVWKAFLGIIWPFHGKGSNWVKSYLGYPSTYSTHKNT